MRIISGKYRGKKFLLPKTLNLHPTTDFAKEGLFNILNNNFDISKIKVLDLFAGSGNISYEFASRGCKDITAIEINNQHLNYINSIIKKLKLPADNIKIIKANVFNYLKNCKETFDIIFADPPYKLKNINQIPDLIFTKKLLNPDGWFVLEHSKKYDFNLHKHFFQSKQYSKIIFSFFK